MKKIDHELYGRSDHGIALELQGTQTALRRISREWDNGRPLLDISTRT